MSENLTKLLSISSAAIAGSPGTAAMASLINGKRGPLPQELCSLLADKNGFFSFESALVVRPVDYSENPIGVLQWNDPKMWKGEYKIDLRESLFFAEDIFGVQFCIRDESILSFDPETGQFTKISDTLEGWANWILEDHRLRTGWPFAHQWQELHGPLKPGIRLLPKVPFVCGGKFSVENWYELKDVDGMRFRASLANQLIGVPDGTQIILKIDRKPQL